MQTAAANKKETDRKSDQHLEEELEDNEDEDEPIVQGSGQCPYSVLI
jgi:hypothetical protein